MFPYNIQNLAIGTYLNTMKTLIFCLLSISATAQSVKSPDGQMTFAYDKTGYRVSYKGTTLIEHSTLTLAAQDGPFALQPGKATYRDGTDDYTLPVGKTSAVHDRYREMTLPLGPVALIVRVFNDGVAFRYTLPGNLVLTDEFTQFHTTGDPDVLAPLVPNFTTSHEHRYTKTTLIELKQDTLMDLPILLTFQQKKIYMAITEADLVDYAGMYLIKHKDILTSRLSPLPNQTNIKVKRIAAGESPWRVLLISDRPGALLESNIITDLNEPCAIDDVSWLHPGKTDFHWWNGDIVPDTNISPGINFETNRYYIDFCARNQIQYHSVIGFGGTAWYTNDGDSYMPGPHTDVTKPVASLDMKQICDYAHSKGVGIRVWVHWAALYPKIDSAFAEWERWGIQGMMVDFMDRDDQEMVNIQREILVKAAAHHLHIQFHGAFKPTGWARTYPNEFTREGTLNYENDKWGDPITPDDDLNVVWTRLLAGSTDYHLGGFRAVTPAQYREHFTHPLVLGTRCHMLAMYVVLENEIGMVCDNPEAYEGQPGFEFIKEVPVTWDETRVPAGAPGQGVAVARRSGDTWYVGVLGTNNGGDMQVPLTFLTNEKYDATMYRDADDDPNHLNKETHPITKTDTLTIHMSPGGGAAIIIHPTGPGGGAAEKTASPATGR